MVFRAVALVLLASLFMVSCRTRGGDDRPSPPRGGETEAVTPPDEASIQDVNVGVRLLEKFQYGEAIARLERAATRNPRWIVPQVDLAIAHLNALEPEHSALAVQAADRALAIDPADVRARYVKAYVLADRERDFKSALPLLRDVVKATDDATAWYQLARASHEIAAPQDGGQPDPTLLAESEKAYRRALALDPNLSEANYRLGRLLLESEEPARHDEGVKLLEGHQAILKGKPAVQQNYLTRGALALAYPWTPPPPKPAPLDVTWRLGAPLTVPPGAGSDTTGGVEAQSFRDGMTIADFDGDGRLDIAAAMRQPSQPAVLTWRGEAGGFSAPRGFGRSGSACGAAAPGDVDGDRDVDLVVTCSSGNVLLVNTGAGFEERRESVLSHPSRAASAATLVDFDHDGDLDAHLIGMGWVRQEIPGSEALATPHWLLRNDGTGAFTDVTEDAGLKGALSDGSYAWTDVDGDNAVDLVAFFAGRGLVVARNDRSGPFSVEPLADQPSAHPGIAWVNEHRLVVGDLDGDQAPEILTFEITQGRPEEGGAPWVSNLVLYANVSRPGASKFAAERTFEASGGAPLGFAQPGCVLLGDFDLDGTRELLVAERNVGTEFVRGTFRDLRRSGGKPLVVRHVGAPELDRTDVAAADLDGDGDLDLMVRDGGEVPRPVWNDMPAGRGWIGLSPVGREGRSNAQGLGAKLTLDAGSLRSHVEHSSSRGLVSHVLAPEIFGLGERKAADGVTVLWPSGIRQAEVELASGRVHVLEELDRQPSSCPMLYGWDGEDFAFLTDCFDTAPAGLWVAPGVHVSGDPDEWLRVRPGAVEPIDGVLNFAVAEFLNESLLADSVRLLAFDVDGGRTLVVDEGVRLGSPPPPAQAWSLAGPLQASAARLDGADVTAELRAQDRNVAGWRRALRFTGIAEPHSLELELPTGRGVLVLTGSLNFPNSSSLFAAHQAGISPSPPKLEVRQGGAWRTLTPDCGVPAGFHKDVVVDLRALRDAKCTLRVTTNLQVSWDRAALYRQAAVVPAAESLAVSCVRAEKSWLGIPREVQGPENRWREFPRPAASGRSDWIEQAGPRTPNGDVRALLAADDDRLVILRPGEEVQLGFDAGALPPARQGQERSFVLATRGWVKDADPHTALSASVLPLPVPGRPTYP